MALELLFDVPEEVVLRQEKWGAQSQELPALKGTGHMAQMSAGSAVPPALTVLSYRAFSTLSKPAPPTFSGYWDSQLGQALSRITITQSDCTRTSRRETERTAVLRNL